ncbi:sensor histidine kinase, partial [Streptomyces seoulensis]
MHRARTRNALVAGARGLALALMGWTGSLALGVLAVLSIAFVPLGVGLLTTPSVLFLVRSHAERRRRLAARWSDVRIPAARYRPL